MNPMQWLQVRVGLRRVAAGCDRGFDLARGVPRQGTLRDELEARRLARDLARDLARSKSRATQGSTP